MANKKTQGYYDAITKAQKEQLALLQKISGLEKSITKEKKENKIFSQSIADLDQSAALAAKARQTAEEGRLGTSQALTSLASIESGMMKDLQTGAIQLGDLYSQQEELLTSMNEEHAAEIAAMEETGAGYGDIVSKLVEQKAAQEEIQKIMTEQVDKAIELNEEMDKQLITGETMRDRLMTQNDTLKSQEGVIGDIQKGAQKYIGIFTNGQAAFAFIANKLFEMAKAARDFAQQVGIGYASAAKLQASANITAAKYSMMGVAVQDVTDAQQELLQLGYSVEKVTMETTDSVVFMSKRFGVATQSAAKLNKIMAGMAGHSQQAADAMLDQAVALAKANKVAPGVVVQEMANNAGEFAAAGKDGFGAMAMTAVAAKKLGMSMSEIASIADGLLNIESSIEAEMQAQVLTGKSINLNRARELANANNLIDMTKELVKQLGSYEQFTNMTRIEQEAYAQSVGMTRTELAKMLQNATKLEGLTAAQKEHYNQTGEILKDNDSILTAENATLAASIATGLVAIGQLAAKGVGLTKNLFLEKSITKEKQKQSKPSKGGGTPGKGFNVKSALKAAAGMLIIAAAMFVFAKAAQQFGDGINWSSVAMGSAILIVLGLAAALIGNMSSQVIQGALAMAILGIALIPAAFAFSLLAGVDAGAIIAMAAAIIVLSAAALVIGSIMMSGVGAVAFAAGAAAIALLGIAIIPFAGALSMLKGVDVEGTMSGIVSLAVIAPLLALAGVGMALLGLGTLGFAAAMYLLAPVIGTALQFSDLMVQLAPNLAALGAVGSGLLAIGPALGLIGLGLIPFSLGLLALAMASSFIPLLGVLGEHMAVLGPALAELAGAGGNLLLIGPGLALLGASLIPFSFGLLALAMTASFIPLLGVLGEHMAVLGPALSQLASAGGNLLLIGPGLALLGASLIPLAFGLLALSFVSGMIPVLGQLAPILSEMAPALVALSAAGQGMFLMGAGFAAFAGGLLLMVPALYALMPLMPTLLLLGGIVGTMGALGAFSGGGEESSEPAGESKEGTGNQEVIAKLDQLIAVIQQPGVINMDGRKVGEVLHMAKGLART